MNYYLLGRSRTPKGPYKLAQLRELYKAGRIPEGTLCCEKGEKKWKPIGQFENITASSPSNTEDFPPVTPQPTQAVPTPSVDQSGHRGSAPWTSRSAIAGCAVFASLATVVVCLISWPFFSGSTESGGASSSGVYALTVTKSFRGDGSALKRVETIDLRKTGEFVWAFEHFVNGVKDMELEDKWDGKWEEKGETVKLTYVYKNLPELSPELNAKAKARAEGVYMFSIEPNGDLLLTGKDSETYPASEQERFVRK